MNSSLSHPHPPGGFGWAVGKSHSTLSAGALINDQKILPHCHWRWPAQRPTKIDDGAVGHAVLDQR
jgi:hypothetical protein